MNLRQHDSWFRFITVQLVCHHPPDMLALVVLLLSPVVWDGTEAACYNGWVQFGSSCYGFGYEYVTWAGASALCNVFDSHLVEVESAEENEFLKQHLRNTSYTAMWLGGTDVFSEGNWIWSGSKSAVGGRFVDWAPGEPNHQGGSTNEDCMQLYRPLNYTWNDEPCNRAYPFVCEIEFSDER